ncbi:MAG: ArsA family ATPase, partial [Nitrospinae bacterium]|nr:ArsA family ATPase [Nitrospinota bacterium]
MTPAKRPPSFLEEPHPRLLLFGGKGGVGKTSLAAATALALAHRFPEKRVLVVSTDPAHSLADSFECPVGPTPRPLYDRPNLFGLELDAAALLEAFLGSHGDVLRRIIMRGTYLGEAESSRFLDLQFPGLDEVMAPLQIRAFLTDRAYDTVVVDTAPTGHTLRLLALPTLVETWIKLLDTLLAKHRYLSQLYAHKYRAGEAEVFLNRLTQDIRGVRRLLQDRDQSLFIPVTIPEEMAVAETRKLVDWLTAAKIPVTHLVINRVMPTSASCPFCLAKWETQRRHLDGLAEMFPTLSCIAVPLFPREVKGEGPLRTMAAALLQPPLPESQMDAYKRSNVHGPTSNVSCTTTWDVGRWTLDGSSAPVSL